MGNKHFVNKKQHQKFLFICLFVCLISLGLIIISFVSILANDDEYQSTDIRQNVPAVYFGQVMADPSRPDFVPTPGMNVYAEIDAKRCGESTTLSEGEQVRYNISVAADSDIGGIPGCGVQGATVTIYVANWLMQPTLLWSSGIYSEAVTLRPVAQLTSTPTPTATSTMTPTATSTMTPTGTPTATLTDIPSVTLSATSTITPSPTPTITRIITPDHSPVTIPEPISAILFSIGLTGIAMYRSLRK